MARGAAQKRNVEPDTAVVTDAAAESPSVGPETAQDEANGKEAVAQTADTAKGSEKGGDEPEDGDDVVQTDGEGRTLVEVVADGVIVRVGGHPLLLTAGQRARVRSEVAERPAFRRV